MKTEDRKFAWGYIRDGEIFFHFNMPLLNKVNCHKQLGMDLLNFAWFDGDIIESTFELLYERYIYLASIKVPKDNILDDLLEFIAPVATRNTYLAAYIAEVIEYLLGDGIDEGLPTAVAELMGAEYGDLIAAYPPDELKGITLRRLPDAIAAQQRLIDEEVELSIGDASPLKDFTPAQRLFILANSEEHKGGHFDMKFQSSLGSAFDFRDMDEAAIKSAIAEYNIDFFEMYELPSIDDMIRFELVQMILFGCQFKRCKYCGKYFVLFGRSDSRYCTRIMHGETKPCNEIGAFRIRTAKLQTDPVLKSYKKAYSRMDSQKRCGSISLQEFNSWRWQAIDLRDHCLAGKITLEEFQEWLNQTKKRK